MFFTLSSIALVYNQRMDVRIKTTDYELTAAARKYLQSRLASLEKLLGSDAAITRCEVVLGRAAGRPKHGDHLYFAEFVIYFQIHFRHEADGRLFAYFVGMAVPFFYDGAAFFEAVIQNFLEFA